MNGLLFNLGYSAADVVALHGRKLQSFAAKLGRRTDAEDVVQDVFATFFARVRAGALNLDSADSVGATLTGMVRRRVKNRFEYDHYGKRAVGRTIHVRHGTAKDGLDSDWNAEYTLGQIPARAVDSPASESVRDWLDALPAEERAAVQLKGDGWTEAEAAAQLGTHERRFRRLLARARAKFVA